MEEEAQVTEEPGQPLKRLRLRYRDGQTSSLSTSNTGTHKTPLVRPKKEPDELPETHLSKLNGSEVMVETPKSNGKNITIQPESVISQSVGKNKGKQPVAPEASVLNEKDDPCQPSSISRSRQNKQLRNDLRSQSHPMRLRDRGTTSVAPHFPPREKRSVPENSSSIKESKIEPSVPLSPKKKSTASHALINPKNEPVTNDMPCFEVPGVIVHPGMVAFLAVHY